MTSNAWTGCTLALSTIGLVIGTAAENARKQRAGESEVRVPTQAVAVLQPTRGNRIRGVVTLTQQKNGVEIRGRVRGLQPGKHGFHIHEYGDLRAPDGTSAGGHFAPEGHRHGGPDDPEHHAGDLGNIVADENGRARVKKFARGLKLHFVIGRSIVVHAEADDLKSQPSGDAGERVALGVIGFANEKVGRSTAASRERRR